MSLNTVSVRLTLEFGADRGRQHRPPARHRLQARAQSPRSRSAPRKSRCSSWSSAYAPFANGGDADRAARGRARAHARTARCCSRARRRTSAASSSRAMSAMMNAMMRETLLTGTARKAQLAGLAGRRQDRHQPGFPRRLVRRLHRPPRHRRLARQRRFLADQESDRRRPAGRNLEPVHARPGTRACRSPSLPGPGGRPSFASAVPQLPAPTPPTPIGGQRRLPPRQAAADRPRIDGWFLDRLFGRR